MKVSPVLTTRPNHVTLAMLVAIASNFIINNALTYRDRRLSGWKLLGGFLRFYLVSMVGLVSNIGVSNWLFANDQKWWVAGLAGAVIGVVWNYVVASLFVWRSNYSVFGSKGSHTLYFFALRWS